MADTVTENVKGFYNETSVKCNFVCNVNEWDLTPVLKELVAKLHPETMKRYYGAGFVIPERVEGLRVLDIGCGSGSLVFILSKLVGPTGSVVGVDFSENLIGECKARQEYHREAWGYDKNNTEFLQGSAENMADMGLKDNSFDVIVSNGVFCLTSDKDKVFAEAFRLLKDGGELYLSDVYASQNAPAEMQGDAKAWVLGLTGSQTLEEFRSSASKAGFSTPLLTGVGPINISDEYKAKLPGSRYCCARNRMFRVPSSGKRGAANVTYKGNIVGQEEAFRWDVSLTFKSGQPVTVDEDLATIFTNTRYRDVFDIVDSPEASATQRGQSPFDYLDKLAAEGTTLQHIYTVE